MRNVTGRRKEKYPKSGNIFGVPIFSRDKVRVLKILKSWLKKETGRRTRVVVTVNPEHVMRALKDREYFEILQKTDLNVVDGVGVAWAVESGRVRGLVGILGGRYQKSLVTGADLTDSLCRMKYKIGFLGGWGDRAKKTERYFKKKYKNLKSVAIGSEYDGKNEEILKKVKQERVEILLVAYAMCRQEKWIWTNLRALSEAGVKIAIGVGRTFDYYSGELPRAPRWLQKTGLEWLFSLITDPGRRGRKWELVRFGWKVLMDRDRSRPVRTKILPEA